MVYFFYSLKFIIGAGAFNVYSHFYFVLNATELNKIDPFMEFETHGILFQKAFSVLPLQFTALISKARKAYDSSRFKACFP